LIVRTEMSGEDFVVDVNTEDVFIEGLYVILFLW
jgi:hypothetical protein